MAGCQPPAKPAPVQSERVAVAPGCVERFDSERDYFPHKVAPRHARRFAVEYHRHYAILSVTPPWSSPGAEPASTLRYVLRRCGTPDPGLPGLASIEIPLRRVATTSTTELPHLVALEMEAAWVGHSEMDFVNAPTLRERVARGEVREIGAPPDIETTIALKPDVLFADFLARTELERLAVAEKAGIPVVMVPSFREASPLGRAEWLLFFGLFLDRPEQAEAKFGAIEITYLDLRQRVEAAALDRPTAYTGGPYQDVWHVPGGRSFVAQILDDAGARYLWADDPSTGALPLNLEAVLARALEGEVWLYPSAWASLEEIAAADRRLTELEAFREGQVWANDRRRNATGGNDFWEQGVTRPDLVLADLVAIFHPDLMPGYEQVFHRQLPVKVADP